MNGQLYTTVAENISMVGDAGDFFQLRGAAGATAVIHEIRVWQRGSTTLTMDTLRLRRGTAGAAGAGITEFEYNTGGSAPIFLAFTLPTTDVGAIDWEGAMGWNNLQEQMWMPPPRLQIPMKVDDDLGIFEASSTAHTGVGCFIAWEEFTA